jgi:hypothetical protein
MVLSDIIYSADDPAGWALIPDPSEKERRFCKKLNIEIIEADIDDLLNTASALPSITEGEPIGVQDVGC